MLKKIKEVINKWELIRYLVVVDMKVTYKNKVFGFLWTLLNPLCLMCVYLVLIFVIKGKGRSDPRFPILLFSALLAWFFFLGALNGSVTSVTSKAKLIQTIYFPKAILPLTKVLGSFLEYLFGLIVLVPMLIIFEANFTFYVLWMPVIILIQLIFTLGLSFYVAWAGIYFRDIQNILRFVLRLWFYLSPALYLVEKMLNILPPSLQFVYMLNPFAALFTSYKNVLVYGEPPLYKFLLITLLIGTGLTVTGFSFFIRQEAKFARDV